MTPTESENSSNVIQNQPKVLIIDDERLLRQSIKIILEKAGFYCETAYDYQSAEKNIENLKFDLILADIVLPKMNGISLVSKLQEEHKIDSIVIFITGEPNLETCSQAIQIGASDYLEKPVSRQKLIDSIKRSFLKKKYDMSIIDKGTKKTIILNESFADLESINQITELQDKLKNPIDEMHKSLVTLKKKYGTSFNDEQRALLNNIAQNNSSLKKILREIQE